MITKLEIFNYESHKRTILDFPTPGLTVFIGESDRGKSGTFRAFNFARTNSPLGKNMFPLYWDGESTVKVFFDTGEVVTRSKSDSVNNYSYLIPGEEEKTVNAGTKVPEEIAAIFNMDEVNYQSQIDRAFLMFDTSGQRGRVLNKIVGLDSIDITLSAAKRDVNHLNQEMGNQKNIMESLETKIQKYDSLPELDQLLIQCEQLERLERQNASVISNVLQIKNSLSKKDEEVKAYFPIAAAQTTILEVKESFVSLKNTQVLVDKILEIKSELVSKKSKLKKLHLLTTAEELTKQIVDKERVLSELSTKNFVLSSIVNKLKSAKEKFVQLEKLIEKEKENIPKNCPACGAEVKT